MNHPSLEVIDKAISLVENGTTVYSCNALYEALSEVAIEDCAAFHMQYIEQYRQFVWTTRHGPPAWWNAPPLRSPRANQVARVRALKGFRQACIDAAKMQRSKT